MENGVTHDVSPPSILAYVTSIAKSAAAWLLLTGSAMTAHAGEEKKTSGFEWKLEAYSAKEYLDGTMASENPWVKIEWKWKLKNWLYAGAGVTQSLSESWEWKTNFWNTNYIKWGWKGEVEGFDIHAWWAVADTAVWKSVDANFGKATIEISKWNIGALAYVSAIESDKKGEQWWTKWGQGWWVGTTYHINDNFDIGVIAWVEPKSGKVFNEIVADIKYEIAKNLYLGGHIDYQVKWTEAWNIHPHVNITYKIK